MNYEIYSVPIDGVKKKKNVNVEWVEKVDDIKAMIKWKWIWNLKNILIVNLLIFEWSIFNMRNIN